MARLLITATLDGDELGTIERVVGSDEEVSADPPPVVTGLTAELASETSVRLRWTDPPESVDAYELEGIPGILASDACEYVIASLPAGTFAPPRIRRVAAESAGPWAEFSSVEVPGAEIVVPGPRLGEYPGPPQGAIAITPGADLSKLSKGAYAMASGARGDLMGLPPSVEIWCETHLGVRVNTSLGKRVAVLRGNVIGGFDITGGGLKPKLNDQQGIAVGDNSSVRWIRYADSLGVAVAFGIGSDAGENVGVFNCEFRNCGSASIGGKGKEAEVAFNLCVDGNRAVKDSDGAGMGKFNRCRDIKVHDNRIVNGWHTLLWFDIRNAGTQVYDNIFDGCARISKSYEGRGVVWEISNRPGELQPHSCRGNTFKNLHGPSVAVEETGGVSIYDNTFFRGLGPEAAELHLRQDDRSDPDGVVWRLRQLRFGSDAQGKLAPNVPGETAQTELLVTRSQSGQRFSPKTLIEQWDCSFQAEARLAF